MAHPTRPDREAALSALRANGWVIKRTAKELGIPESTLRRWAKQAAREGEKKKPTPTDAELAEHLRGLAERIIGLLLESRKIEDAAPRDLGIILGIILDKLTNLTGSRVGEDGQLAALVATIQASRAKR